MQTSNGTALVYGLLLLFAYFFPSINEYQRGHRSAGAIVLLNLFLGWTFLGWVGALVWSATGNTKKTIVGRGWNRRIVDEDDLRVRVLEKHLARDERLRAVEKVIEAREASEEYWKQLSTVGNRRPDWKAFRASFRSPPSSD